MRIGLVSPYDFFHPGGVNSHVRQLATCLRRNDHEVKILAPASGRRERGEHPDLYRLGRALPIPANDSVARISINLSLASRLGRILEAERFDVLHFHEPLMPTVPLTLLRVSDTANVGTFHAYARRNLGYYYGRPLLKPYLRRLHATMAVSAAARDFVAHYFDVHPSIVPNGVDMDLYHPGQTPIHHLRDGCVNVLFVGRLEKRKGLRDLLRAFEYLKARVPRSRLVVVGEGPLRSQIEGYVSGRGLEDVVVAGFVPRDVLPRYYTTADIFCAPATGAESFGIVLLEAMASGVPVLATEIPGYLSVLDPGRDGVTVRPKAWAELGVAMTMLARDSDLRRRLADAGLTKARRFSWRTVTASILDVYEEAREALGGKETHGVHEPVPSLG